MRFAPLGTASVGDHVASMALPSFSTLANQPSARLDQLALALAAEFRPGAVDADATILELDRLGEELAATIAARGARAPEEEADACAELLGDTYGFEGDDDEVDHPDNSMLDLVVARRVGLPILLSAVYVEVARRAGVRVLGVGLPGHFVVAHFGAEPPVVLDPFGGGRRIEARVDASQLRPWGPHETALRMLNNLVASYERRGDIARAIRCAELRLQLPASVPLRDELELALRSIRARLN